MSNKQVTLRAKGKVQKVGYRDFVQDLGRKLGVVGYVENMRDGSVQIVCEGEDAVIGKFQKAIKVKIDFIDVEDLCVVETKKATGEFEYFDIRYGSTAEEIGDRMGAGIQYIAATTEEVKASRQDIRDVGEKINVLTVSTKENFNELGEKYHVISENMDAMNKNIEKMVDALTLLVKDHIERDKQ